MPRIIKLAVPLICVALLSAPRAGAQHFQWARTADNLSVLVEEALLFEEPLQPEDEIGVFDPDGVCAGGVVVEEAGVRIGFAAWGDDEWTDADEGFEDGDQMQFRFWDAANERESIAEYELLLGDITWSTNAVTIINLSYSSGPLLIVDPDTIAFGSTPVGGQEEAELSISNFGDSLLVVSAIQITEAVFTTNLPDTGISVLPGGDAIIIVTFTPDNHGEYEAALTVFSNAYFSEVTKTLLGSAYFPAHIQLDREEIDFGEAQVDDAPEYGTEAEVIWDTLWLSNDGEVALDLSHFEFGLPDVFGLPGEFPDDLLVEPTDTTGIPIYFNPAEVTAYDSWFSIASNDPINSTVTVRLLGMGMMPNRAPEEHKAIGAAEFSLRGLYPNPFNDGVVISYHLPNSTPVSVAIFNALGEKVASLGRGYQSAGRQEIFWRGLDDRGMRAASGLYLVRITAGRQSVSGRLFLQH